MSRNKCQEEFERWWKDLGKLFSRGDDIFTTDGVYRKEISLDAWKKGWECGVIEERTRDEYN